MVGMNASSDPDLAHPAHKVAVVTDSVAGLPPALQARYGIRVAPAMLIWSGEEFRDGVDMQPEAFYTRLAQDSVLPTTAAVPVPTFRALFESCLEQGFDVLGIFISARLSAVFENALRARAQLGRGNIELIDSQTFAMMLGFAAIRAAEAAAAGLPLADCAAVARRTLAKADGFAVVDTLTYLQRGGRISNAQWLFGTALQLKPVLSMVDGRLVPVERVRTRKRALQRMLDMAAARIDGRGPLSLAVMHANAPERAEALLDAAAARLQPAESFLTTIGPTIGTHAGPGALGLCFQYGEVGLPAAEKRS